MQCQLIRNSHFSGSAIRTHLNSSVAVRPTGFVERQRKGEANLLHRGTCVDDPLGWGDTLASTCADYKTFSWCTSSGGYGSGWDSSSLGDFSLYAVNGIDATDACCHCGGGQRTAPQHHDTSTPQHQTAKQHKNGTPQDETTTPPHHNNDTTATQNSNKTTQQHNNTTIQHHIMMIPHSSKTTPHDHNMTTAQKHTNITTSQLRDVIREMVNVAKNQHSNTTAVASLSTEAQDQGSGSSGSSDCGSNASGSNAGPAKTYSVGEQVRVRDKDDEEWKDGVITSVIGGAVSVKPTGWETSHNWDEIHRVGDTIVC